MKQNINIIIALVAILLVLWLSTTLSRAEEVYSGRDMQCHAIGYLSSECKGTKAVPFHMFDKEVSLAKAKTADNIMNITSKTVNNNYEMTVSGKPASDKVKVTSYFDEDFN